MKKYLLATGLTLVAAPALAELSCVNVSDTDTKCAELGFKQTSSDCTGKPSLKCPFDQTKLFCDGISTSTTCSVGNILYSDGTCSSSKMSGKTVVGVVFDAENKLVVSLNAKNSITWGGSDWGTDASKRDISALIDCTSSIAVKSTCGIDGKSNTAAIVAQLGTDEEYAARYCYELTDGGKTAKSWWLPSMKELNTLYANKTSVDAGLTNAGGTNTSSSGYWWSSTELGDGGAWALSATDGKNDKHDGYQSRYAYCVTSF